MRGSPTPPIPFPKRPRDAHKVSVGKVWVVAGSRGMSGAACLTGEAALRCGAGLVTVAGPAGVNRVLEIKLTCVMTRPFPETEAGGLAEAGLAALWRATAEADALAIGPGLGRDPETIALVQGLVARAAEHGGPPLVLDADGLNAFTPELGRTTALELLPLQGRAVLTPHPGEAARLRGEPTSSDPAGRLAAAQDLAGRTGLTTLLKGAGTVVAAPGRDPYLNPTGNPGLATGGSGDVLTGVIAALLAAGLAPFEAACLGAWLQGRAGDLAAENLGWAGLTAADLLPALPLAIRDIEDRETV